MIGLSWATHFICKSELDLTWHYYFVGLFKNTLDISVSLPSDNCLKIQKLAHSLLKTQSVTISQIMPLLGKVNFCVNTHAQLSQLSHVIQNTMLNVYHSLSDLFCLFYLSSSNVST